MPLKQRRKSRGRRGVVLLLTALLLAVAVAAPPLWRRYRPAPSPAAAVSGLLGALKRGDIERASSYTLEGLGLRTDNCRARALYKEMYATLRYVVADSAVSGDRAQVTVSVTMVDMDAVLTGASQELLSRSLTGEAADQKKFYRMLTEAIHAGSAPPATYTVPVLLVRQESGWRVEIAASNSFLLAITGGIGPF